MRALFRWQNPGRCTPEKRPYLSHCTERPLRGETCRSLNTCRRLPRTSLMGGKRSFVFPFVAW